MPVNFFFDTTSILSHFWVNCPMLSQDDKDELKSKIEAQLKKLESKIEEYKELTKPIAPENAIGRVSRMDAINNKSVNEAALRQAEKKKQGLLHALEKMDEEHFGLCTSCGKNIPVGRIMLMPGSTKCVQCAN